MHERQLRLWRGRESVGLADAVRHPFAQADHQVRLLHLRDQCRRNPDAHVAAIVRMRGVEQLRPAMRRVHRQHPAFRQSFQIIGHRRIVERIMHQLAAHQHQRPFRLGQHLRQPVQILRPRPGHRPGAGQVDLGVGGLVENILRQNNRHRARRAGFRQMERPRDRLGSLFRLVHVDHRLRHVGEHLGVVLFLQRLPPVILALHLPDQHHQRRRVVIRRVHRHHGIGHARPARNHAHPGARPHPPVRHRHEPGPALVPADHHADRVHVGQRVGQADIAFARHAENLIHIMRFQTFRQQAGNGSGHVRFSP